MISSTLGVPAAAAAVIAAKYPLSAYSSPAVALGAVGTDAIFACPAVSAELSLSQYVPTYAYEFNDENAPMRFLPNVGFPYGAYHAAELQYLFTLSSTPLPGTFTPAQQDLAAAMQRDWTTFARFGAPVLRRGLAAVHPDRPAGAVAGPAPAAGRDGLRDRAPVRLLGQPGRLTPG